ncbi:MAG: hypothetical protein WCW13_03870 [archaeon]|jgi:hypothetical protein
MSKGQIFSIDFILAMVLVIFGIGTMMAIAEFNMYNIKQKQEYSNLTEKTQSALIVIANSEWSSCKIGNTFFPYSINSDKLNLLIQNPVELKKRLALQDYNTQIISDGTRINYDTINSDNIVALELNILYCNNSTTATDVNNCMNSTTKCTNNNFKTGNISIKVGQ